MSEKFQLREVYAKCVQIYQQIGGICEISSDISCYLPFAKMHTK